MAKIDPTAQAFTQEARAAKENAAAENNRQIESKADVMQAMDNAIYNPFEQEKKSKELAERARDTEVRETPREEEGADSSAREKAADVEKNNPELSAKSLLAARENLSDKDSTDQLLSKMRDAYPDPALADEALDYMIDASGDNKELQAKLRAAKEQFNNDFGREIRSGRNIHTEARAFSEQGLGSPTALRDLYRDVTGNPRSPNTLFQELTGKFSFEEMKKVIEFMMHSLGADMKAKGPSIPTAELQRLFTETRTMQAIIGVYRFFEGRMALINGEFGRSELMLPGQINFQTLAKLFMQFIQDRYPSAAKVFAMSSMLGISEELEAQIIIYMQYRDAMRNVSPRLFQNEKHRQGLLMTLIEALSELEEITDEEEDEEEEDLYEDTLE